MRVYYRLRQQDELWTAESVELDAYGRGTTPQSAVDDLVRYLTDRFNHVEAMAPPSRPEGVEIEAVPLPEPVGRDALESLPDADLL
ncbi:MAG: hypothetical protein U0414_16075 [Polyangiaceae bacterium]